MSRLQPLLLTGLLLAWAPALPAEVIFRTVALTGMQAPDTPAGTHFTNIGHAAVNSSGRTAFLGGLFPSPGVTTSNSSGIWSESAGELTLIARAGNAAPGTSNAAFDDTIGRPALNAHGHVAFFAELQGSGVSRADDTGIWSDGSGTLALIAREGSQAPGAPAGANFAGLAGHFTSPTHSDSGTVAFRATLQNAIGISMGDGIWSGSSGALAPVALTGNHAPGTPSGTEFNGFGDPVLNPSGRTAFRAGLRTHSGAPITDDDGVWSEGSGTLALVARDGGQAPGTPTGGAFLRFRDPVMNAAGRTAFVAFLQNGSGGVTFNDDQGIWSEGSGTLALVAREGSHAPGTPDDANFYRFNDPVLSASGRTAFRADLQYDGGSVTANNDSGLWSEGSGALALVAREGSQAPGTPEGARFADFSESLNSPVLNASGRMAFRALLRTGSGGVNASNNEGLWAEDPFGRLTLVVRKGDLLEVAPGDFRTAAAFGFGYFHPSSGGQDGRPVTFNDSFTLAFFAQFTNGTAGILTATLTAVPEPATLTILLILLVSASFSRLGR